METNDKPKRRRRKKTVIEEAMDLVNETPVPESDSQADVDVSEKMEDKIKLEEIELDEEGSIEVRGLTQENVVLDEVAFDKEDKPAVTRTGVENNGYIQMDDSLNPGNWGGKYQPILNSKPAAVRRRMSKRVK